MEAPLCYRDDTSEPVRSKRRRKRRRRCKRHPNDGPHSLDCRGTSVKGRSNNAQCLVRVLPTLKPVLDYLHVHDDVFTREQIMGHLTEYIKQKSLFDPNDPRKVYCQNDELALIFGCKEFSTANACQLLLQNIEAVSTTDCSCSESDQYSMGELSTTSQRLPSTLLCCQPFTYTRPLTIRQLPLTYGPLPSPSTTLSCLDQAAGSKRQRDSSDVSETTTCLHKRPRYDLYFSPFCPEINSDDNGEYCTHYKQVCDNTTDIVTDTSDDLFFLNETDDEPVVVPRTDDFVGEIEYEPITFSDEETLIALRRQFGDDTEEESTSFETEIDEGEDGGDELNDNDDSDSEIEEDDKWKCERCAERNHPMTRNCRKCWDVRKDWYPSALHRSMSDPTPATTQPPMTDETPGSDTASTSHNIPQATDHNNGSKCVVCLTDPPDGCIIHGQTGHQVCCVACAKKLKEAGRPCPVCRKKIRRVITNFM